MRLQEWLDDEMVAEERAIFETELGADPEKADLAEKSKRINDNLKALAEETLKEKIPNHLLKIVKNGLQDDGDDGR